MEDHTIANHPERMDGGLTIPASILHIDQPGYPPVSSQDFLVGQEHALEDINHAIYSPLAGAQAPGLEDSEAGRGGVRRKMLLKEDANARASKGSDSPWTNDEEKELLALIQDELFRTSKIGIIPELASKWPYIAEYFSRTVKAVKRKYERLHGPASQQQKEGSRGSKLTTSTSTLDHGEIEEDMQFQPSLLVHNPSAPLPTADTADVEAFYNQIHFYNSLHESGDLHDLDAQLLAYNQQHHGVLNHSLGLSMPQQQQQQQQQPQQQQPTTSKKQNKTPNADKVAPRNDGAHWTPEEQQQLVKLAQESSYRAQVLGGSGDLDWDAIANHLGRSKRSTQRKWDNIKITLQDTTAAVTTNDGKKWTREEMDQLVRLVEDEGYRLEQLGVDRHDWRVLGAHFNRSHEAVSYKYSYIKNTEKTKKRNSNDGRVKHAKAKHETSYKTMAIWALTYIGGSGTSNQICAKIETNPTYAPQLDMGIVSGKKTLPRWKHGVRSALNAFGVFKKTDQTQDGEVVWNLVAEKVELEAQAQQEKEARQQRKRPKKQVGVPPLARPTPLPAFVGDNDPHRKRPNTGQYQQPGMPPPQGQVIQLYGNQPLSYPQQQQQQPGLVNAPPILPIPNNALTLEQQQFVQRYLNSVGNTFMADGQMGTLQSNVNMIQQQQQQPVRLINNNNGAPLYGIPQTQAAGIHHGNYPVYQPIGMQEPL